MAKSGDDIAIMTRTINILSFITEAGRSVTIPEVIDEVKLPRPTVHRICNTLQSMGLLARDRARNRLIAGPALTDLAFATLSSTEVTLARRAILRRTVVAVHETVTLSVLANGQLLFLDRVESESPLRLHLYAGSRTPLYCTSAGKLFLAMQSEDFRNTWLESCSLAQFTQSTIINVQQLAIELDSIRARKVSIDNQEYIDGLVAIAVPVLNRRGKMIAAVSVNGPASRICLKEQERYLIPLKHAAEQLRLCLS